MTGRIIIIIINNDLNLSQSALFQRFSFAIDSVQWEDAGYYRVDAENQFGTTFCNFTLTVIEGYPTAPNDEAYQNFLEYDYQDFDAPVCQAGKMRGPTKPCFTNPDRLEFERELARWR